MKREVYGTWQQIKYVINKNTQANLTGGGYDYYEVEQIVESELPVISSRDYGGSSWSPSYNVFINLNQMENTRNHAHQDAKRTNSPLEVFRITLYKQ